MGKIKDRNGMDQTEAEILRRGGKSTQKNYTKNLHDPDNHDGMITHLEPDILECEVKWALESITVNKASGGDGIPVELFQILKNDAVKVLHSICQQIWKTSAVATDLWSLPHCRQMLYSPALQDWKRSVFIPILKKGNAKECSNYRTIALISHASKVMLKILQAKLQQYVNHELPDVQAGSRKGRGTRDQIANIHWIIKKAREFQKNICYWLCESLWLCGSQQTGKFLKGREYQTTGPASWEICMQVKKQQLELDMEQNWFQIRKGVLQGCMLLPCLFNLYAEYIMRNARLEEAQARIKISGRNINNLRYADDTTLMAESEEELRSLLMKVKEETEKVGLKLNIQKTKIMASGPIISWQIGGETMENSDRFYFGGLQNHCRWWLQPWN